MDKIENLLQTGVYEVYHVVYNKNFEIIGNLLTKSRAGTIHDSMNRESIQNPNLGVILNRNHDSFTNTIHDLFHDSLNHDSLK